MLFLLLPMRPNTFFFVQAVAREYLLDGEIGSLEGYGGTLSDFGEAVWYDGKTDWRRSEVRMRKGLPDFVGVTGSLTYEEASSDAAGVPIAELRQCVFQTEPK